MPLAVFRAATLAIVLGFAGAASASPATERQVAVADFELTLDDSAHLTPVRVLHPVGPGSYPIVLFSHGAYSAGDLYDALLETWAAAGYVVIAPTHRDSTRLGTERFDPAVASIWPTRMGELSALLSHAEAGTLPLPRLRGELDVERVAAAGHSLGALVAMALTGLSTTDREDGTRQDHRDPRIDAWVSLGGPGELPFVPRAAWSRLALPGLVQTGTADVARGDTVNTWEWRRQPFDFAPAGDKYLLVIEGADHYLGGRVGRDDLPVSDEAGRQVEAVNRAVLRFLDAYLRDDAKARAALERGDFVEELPAEAVWASK